MASPFQWVSDVWGIMKDIVMDCPKELVVGVDQIDCDFVLAGL